MSSTTRSATWRRRMADADPVSHDRFRRAAWADAGRPGEPELWGPGYFALGDGACAGRDYLLDYYAFTGPFSRRIADVLLTNPLEVREFLQGYADAGCDRLNLLPTVADLTQLERLADAVAH